MPTKKITTKKVSNSPKIVSDAFFENTSTVNIFTTIGRCMPGEKILLSLDEGEALLGLTKCQK